MYSSRAIFKLIWKMASSSRNLARFCSFRERLVVLCFAKTYWISIGIDFLLLGQVRARLVELSHISFINLFGQAMVVELCLLIDSKPKFFWLILFLRLKSKVIWCLATRAYISRLLGWEKATFLVDFQSTLDFLRLSKFFPFPHSLDTIKDICIMINFIKGSIYQW